jgi:hypothetical protein
MPLSSLYAPIIAAVSGRPWIICWPRAGAAEAALRTLLELGADPPLVLALRAGRPLPDDLRRAGVLVHTDAPPPPVRADEQRAFEAWCADLPPAERAAIARFDPGGRAAVWAPHGIEALEVGGRPIFGADRAGLRRQVEDKTRVAQIWDELGLPAAPSRVCGLDEAPAAGRRLPLPHGAVWAADNRRHIQAGATGTRWVHGPATRAAAVRAFADQAHTVRVMPYLAGQPCAVQGICLARGVAVFRPAEMLVLEHPADGAFALLGVSTLWRPTPALDAEIRAAGRAVGAWLQARGHRGGYSVDGVAGGPGGGFWPTEVNLRFTAGLQLLDELHGGPPLDLVHRLAAEGGLTDLDPQAVERAVLSATRARGGVAAAWTGLPAPDAPPPARQAGPLRLRWEDAGGEGVVVVERDPLAPPSGDPLTPALWAALAAAAAAWGIAAGGWRPAGAGRSEPFEPDSPPRDEGDGERPEPEHGDLDHDGAREAPGEHGQQPEG